MLASKSIEYGILLQEAAIKQVERANTVAVDYINESLYDKAIQQLSEAEQILEKLAYSTDIGRVLIVVTMYCKAAAFQK